MQYVAIDTNWRLTIQAVTEDSSEVAIQCKAIDQWENDFSIIPDILTVKKEALSDTIQQLKTETLKLIEILS